MFTALRRTALFACMGLAIASTGCESADRPLPLSPMTAEVLQNGNGPPVSRNARLIHAKDNPALADSVDVQVISTGGGVLRVGPHRLVVPFGAVRMPTIFRMEVLPNPEGEGPIIVQLTARRASNLAPVTSFSRELTLRLDYSLIIEDVSEDRLAVFHLRTGAPDGVLERRPTTVDRERKWLDARLTHFSKYAIGAD
jgi:hypothetical protein